MGIEARSSRGIIRSKLDVKGWMESEPSASEARPGQCPNCGTASQPAGGGIAVQGHGRRTRQLRGPATVDGTPEIRECSVRRYRCTRCGATTTVAPRETLTHRLFSAPAIALALALFGLTGLALHDVRKRVSPWTAVGATAASTWGTVPRWTRAVREGRLFSVRRVPEGWSVRQVAARAATTLAAQAPLAPGSPDLVAAAFAGALAP
jgi:hypothetical protein